jgi:transposase
MTLRIQWQRLTVKALQVRLHRAYARGDVRLVRRISVLLEVGQQVGQPQGSIAAVATKWGLSRDCVYKWLHAFLLERLDSLRYTASPGRPCKLTSCQKQRLCQLLDAGPQAAGFVGAWWNSVLIAEMIRREFNIVYNRFYVCTLLKNLGYTFQKAQFVSDHLDEERRRLWLEQVWPQLLHRAKRLGALILFGDEASFAHWGWLSYTWAKQGHTPQVKTSGKRKAYKVFGLIEFFSGRLFYQGIEGRFNSQSYQEFISGVLAQTKQHLFLIQDGARYHTSAAIREFFAAHRKRLTVFQLPSYSPDYNPIEYLWRNTKKRATHNQYFAEFEQLTSSVAATLAHLAAQAQELKSLFGRYCREVGLHSAPLQLAA